MMRGNGSSRLVSDINVTPLVDVMLVLLIIFMVTAPMMTQGVDVDLPQTTTLPLRQQDEPMIVTIKGSGEIFLNKTQCSQAVLKQQLLAKSTDEQERPIYLQADRQVPYGVVVAVMATIKDAGFNKLGMVTRPPEEQP